MLVLNLNTIVVVADCTLVHLGFRVLIRSGLCHGAQDWELAPGL